MNHHYKDLKIAYEGTFTVSNFNSTRLKISVSLSVLPQKSKILSGQTDRFDCSCTLDKPLWVSVSSLTPKIDQEEKLLELEKRIQMLHGWRHGTLTTIEQKTLLINSKRRQVARWRNCYLFGTSSFLLYHSTTGGLEISCIVFFKDFSNSRTISSNITN